MRKETLVAIVDRAAVFTKENDIYRSQSGHNVALYLGEPGNAMVISGVQRMIFCAEFIEINAKPNTTLYVSYEAIHALSTKQEETANESRANVGF
jgi:hypothetical protein